MRNTEQRVVAVKRRTKEIQREKQMRRNRIVGISSVAACLFSVIGLAFAMPGIMEGLPVGEYTYSGAAASIFDGGGGFGYVLIGLLAFVLGVSVTILCYRIRPGNQEGCGDMEDRDD